MSAQSVAVEARPAARPAAEAHRQAIHHQLSSCRQPPSMGTPMGPAERSRPDPRVASKEGPPAARAHVPVAGAATVPGVEAGRRAAAPPPVSPHLFRRAISIGVSQGMRFSGSFGGRRRPRRGWRRYQRHCHRAAAPGVSPDHRLVPSLAAAWPPAVSTSHAACEMRVSSSPRPTAGALRRLEDVGDQPGERTRVVLSSGGIAHG